MKFSISLYIYLLSYIHLLKRKFKYTEHTVNGQVSKTVTVLVFSKYHYYRDKFFKKIIDSDRA